MGPILLLDKSAFQALSRNELLTFQSHFMQTLPPILVFEIAGDLAKEVDAGASADEKVAELAAKFGGSGPATTWDYHRMCLNSLDGNDVPMTGAIPAKMARPVPDPDGQGFGLFIEPSPENEAILRWARGQFLDEERNAAERWRAEAKELTLEPLQEALDAHHVVFPRCTTVAEAFAACDDLLATAALQPVWIEWLLTALEARDDWMRSIRARWRDEPGFLENFAPYAHHCARALLAFAICRRFRLVTERPTDLLDLEYLYYAPFCMGFCSTDRFQRALAPPVLRQDQMFIHGPDLKADLRRIHEAWGGLDEDARSRRGFALGSYPVPARDSVVCEIWGRSCVPWHPGAGNRAFELAEPEQQRAVEEVNALFSDAGVGFDYQPIDS